MKIANKRFPSSWHIVFMIIIIVIMVPIIKIILYFGGVHIHKLEIQKAAKSYLSEKYHESFSLVDFEDRYDTFTFSFPKKNGNAIITFHASDNSNVEVYYKKDGACIDDYQYTKILDALKSEYIEPIFGTLENCYLNKEVMDVDNVAIYPSYFKEYFYEDIQKYIQNEKKFEIAFGGNQHHYDNIYVVCNSVDDAKQISAKIEYQSQKFNCMFKQKLYFVSQQAFDQYKNGKLNLFTINTDGCYYITEISGEVKHIEQKRIKVSEGIYAQSNIEDFVLEDGDIALEYAMTNDQINDLLKIQYKEKHKKNQTYEIVAETPLYKIVLSDRINKLSQKRSISICFNYDYKTLGLSADSLMFTSRTNSIWPNQIDKNSGETVVNNGDYFWIGSKRAK